MFLAKTLQFYKRREVQKAIVEQAIDREVAVQFKDFFGKRPEALFYENDVLEFATRKATSFHCSEELWNNPLSLRSDMKREEQDDLRKGWDLILDIDCQHFTYSKIATHILVKTLKDLGIANVSCKFSGNKGFHIGIPFESFPETINGSPTRQLFPEAPRRIAMYLKDKLKPLLEKAILKAEKNQVENVVKRTNIPYEELVVEDSDSGIERRTMSLDTEKFLEIDTVLIASRHLYRMPYSFHEKSELVSVPVNTNEILSFKKEQAEPDKVDFDVEFLNRDKSTAGEASKLVLNAYDFYPEKKEEREKKEYTMPEEAIPEDCFPPTINNILKGLEDGKKRATFTLINFFKGVGWPDEAIEEKLYGWNERNPEPLREVYLKGQIKQMKKQKEPIPPHNYPMTGETYYKDLGVWNPDPLEKKVKNPLQYAKIKYQEKHKKPKGRPKLTEEQKEMRRKYREKKKEQENN